MVEQVQYVFGFPRKGVGGGAGPFRLPAATGIRRDQPYTRQV